MKIMVSSPITSCQVDGETMETVTDFILGGYKITVDGECSHEIKTLAPWKKNYDLQVSQEAGQVVWYSHLSQNFLQFLVIHTVKGFGIVKRAEIDVFLELSCFFNGPADVGNLSLVPLPFLKSA